MGQENEQGKAERRQAPRRAFHGAVEVRLPNGQAYQWRGIDLSESGIGLECPVNLPGKLPCELAFTLLVQGQPQAVRVSAVVAHSVVGRRYAGFQVGCQFVRLADDVVQTIRRYVSP